MQRTLHFLVSGRVQGVFFRAACKRVADDHGLSGWVRNVPGGQVEGVASGDADALRGLREWLRHGPELARVDRLDIKELPLQTFDRFVIRR